jgi:twitching motility two-component system response regulator PilG
VGGALVSKKILVADDSPTVRRVAESLLRKQGYDVVCAEDGATALGLVKASRPDLIFWDASLPILDGRSFCQELKGNGELKETPVIILLTKDQVDKEKELRDAGADAFAVKPFNPKEILEKVQEFLREEGLDLKEEMPTGPKKHPAGAEKKPRIDKVEESSVAPKEKKKMDESLDIIETSDFLENFKASLSASDAAQDHGFEWFVSELRKELKETKEADKGSKQETEDEAGPEEIASPPEMDLEKKDEDEKKEEVLQLDQDQKGDEDFLGELKGESEETKVEEFSLQEAPLIDYDKAVDGLIEKVSTKIAQEVAKRIDPEILRKTLQDEVEKLKREGTETD